MPHRMCCGVLTSCALSCCSACACKVCCRFGNARSVGVKLLYAFLLLFTSLIALGMLGTSVQHWLSEQLSDFWFTGAAEMGDDLVGTLAVTRIMSATVTFHLVLALLVCGVQNSKGVRADLHNGFWPVKILSLLALMVLMFFLPNELFVGLSSTLYRVGGGLYILIQLILFLGWVVSFYHYVFVKYISQGEWRGWACVVIALTLIAYAWVIFVVVATVIIHADGDGCAEGLAGSFVGLVGCIVVSVLSVSGCASGWLQAHPPLCCCYCTIGLPTSALLRYFCCRFVRNAENNHQAQSSGLFQSAMVACYCSYLVCNLKRHVSISYNRTCTEEERVALTCCV
eukprot:COSAG02_NODE_791_length_17158_cov_12.377396_11_plen_341_part_00